MAHYHQWLLAFALILNIHFSSLGYAIAARNVASKAKEIDKKQPELFHNDPTVLVPGLGRYMHPKKYLHCKNPLKYNPVTGTCAGNGLVIPGRGSIGGAGRGFIPGGDDTFVPNPGFEVPNPGNGGRIPGMPRP